MGQEPTGDAWGGRHALEMLMPWTRRASKFGLFRLVEFASLLVCHDEGAKKSGGPVSVTEVLCDLSNGDSKTRKHIDDAPRGTATTISRIAPKRP